MYTADYCPEDFANEGMLLCDLEEGSLIPPKGTKGPSWGAGGRAGPGRKAGAHPGRTTKGEFRTGNQEAGTRTGSAPCFWRKPSRPGRTTWMGQKRRKAGRSRLPEPSGPHRRPCVLDGSAPQGQPSITPSRPVPSADVGIATAL